MQQPDPRPVFPPYRPGGPTLTITRGLPASGKTTYARLWVEADRARRVRVNRDDLRSMTDGGVFVKGVTEPRILAARDALLGAWLGTGLDVICDDTNLPFRAVADLARVAVGAGAGLAVVDFTAVPAGVCVARDHARLTGRVGEAVIRDMWAAFVRGRPCPLPLEPDLPARVPEGAPA